VMLYRDQCEYEQLALSVRDTETQEAVLQSSKSGCISVPQHCIIVPRFGDLSVGTS